MYRSLQQTPIPPAAASGTRAGGDRIPLKRLNEDEYDEVPIDGGVGSDGSVGSGGDGSADPDAERVRAEEEAAAERTRRRKRKKKGEKKKLVKRQRDEEEK